MSMLVLLVLTCEGCGKAAEHEIDTRSGVGESACCGAEVELDSTELEGVLGD